MQQDASAAIGVFDSGLGGLTVLRTLLERLPNENFIYLGDTARIPYGTKSAETVRRYLNQNINILQELNVKAVVIACNSASSVAEGLEYSIPVYDVIRPGARRAAAVTKSGRVGVLGTRTTVASGAYVRALEKINPSLHIFQQAASLLVPLAEEGLLDDPITNFIVYRYVSSLLAEQIDTLILGCTHFPILRTAIEKAAGRGVECVDSSEAICEDLVKDFSEGKLLPNRDAERSVKYYSTDRSDHMTNLARMIMAPHPAGPFELLDIG